MKTSKAYIASFGTSGVLIASFVLLLVVVSAIVAFRGGAALGQGEPMERLEVHDGRVGGAPAERTALAATADREADSARGRSGGDSAGHHGRREAELGAARHEGESGVSGGDPGAGGHTSGGQTGSRGGPGDRSGAPEAPPAVAPPQTPPSAGDVGDEIEDTTGALGRTVERTTGELGDTIGGVAPRLGETVTETGRGAGEAVERVGQTVDRAVDRLDATVDRATERVGGALR